LDLARWQFALTTVYHFLFVPITIGLSGLVAVCETMGVRRDHEHWLRLTKFFGKLFLMVALAGMDAVVDLTPYSRAGRAPGTAPPSPELVSS
jgi:cytochrome bd-type quinol oxidase subunit 1